MVVILTVHLQRLSKLFFFFFLLSQLIYSLTKQILGKVLLSRFLFPKFSEADSAMDSRNSEINDLFIRYSIESSMSWVPSEGGPRIKTSLGNCTLKI